MFKKLVVAAAFAFALPFAASAATDICDDVTDTALVGPFAVDTGIVYNCDITLDPAAAAGTFSWEFESNTAPFSAIGTTTELVVGSGTFGAISIAWFSDAALTTMIGAATDLVEVISGVWVGASTTTYTGPTPESRYLALTWSGFTGSEFDVNVTVNEVPLPAAGFLLLGGLGGLVAMKRRKKAA